MTISLTSSGRISSAYKKAYPQSEIYSFRNMSHDDMCDIIKHSDVLIHSAAPRVDDPVDHHVDGYGLTSRIIDAVNHTNKEIRFINLGSMSYLDSTGYMSDSEMTHYALWKYRSELLCLDRLSNVVSVRMSTVFYKDGESDILSRLVKDASKGIIDIWNNGEATRDFIPIDIAVRYLDYAGKHKTDKTVNICSEQQTSFLDVVDILREIYDFELVNHSGNMPLVLSKFTLSLPKIDFSLKEEIKKYIECEQ